MHILTNHLLAIHLKKQNIFNLINLISRKNKLLKHLESIFSIVKEFYKSEMVYLKKKYLDEKSFII